MYNLIKIIFNDFPLPKKYKKTYLSLTEHIGEINTWLDSQLAAGNSGEGQTKNTDDRVFNDPQEKVVHFIVISESKVKSDENKLLLKSNDSFVTVKANCGVLRGKWQYEVQLHSKDIMQIGWCSSKCKFSDDSMEQGVGIGDTDGSYGYDGSKKRIWHVQSRPYGTTFWRTGDIIGVCIDIEARTIEFYRNGKSLGVAFENIQVSEPFYPGVSLAFTECLSANFGGSPLRFPITGFSALQDPPLLELQRCETLLMYVSDLAQFNSKYGNSRKGKELKLADSALVSEDAAILVFGSMIVERLTGYLTNRYIVEALFLPYIKKLCIMRSVQGKSSPLLPGHEESTLGCLLTLLWDHLDFDEMTKMLEILISYMESVYKEISNDAEYEKQRSIIVILTCLCNHTKTRKYLLKEFFFKNNCLALFLYIKPPEEEVLEKIIPDKAIWTSALGGNKSAYLLGCEKLQLCTNILYNLQKNLLNILLRNDDGNDRQPSSRKIFIALFRRFIFGNCVEHRMADLFQAMLHGYVVTPTQPAIGLAFLCLLLDVLKAIWDKDFMVQQMFVEPKHFYDGTLKYKSTDRVGGVISYLRKVHRSILIENLGEGHETLTPEYEQSLIQSELNDIYSSLFVISGSPSTGFSVLSQTHNEEATNSPEKNPKPIVIEPGNSDELKSIFELVDSGLLLYFTVAHKYLLMVAELRDNLASLPEKVASESASDSSAPFSLDDTGTGHNEASLSERMRTNFLNNRSKLMIRKQAWYRAVSFNRSRRNLLIWLFEWSLNTAKYFSTQEQLFTFLPETYINILPLLLDAILDFSFHDIDDQFDLKSDLPLLKKAAQFLSLHIADNRIILAACKDAIIQCLGTLACHQTGIQALESTDANAQMSLMESLLRPYENRAWGQSNWLLLRFWLGHGFAFREARPANPWNNGDVNQNLGLVRRRGKTTSYTGLLHLIAPACPSVHYQCLVVRLLKEYPDYCLKFVNSLLEQLNWSFSEFVQISQEIQTILLKDSKQQIDSRQLKICTMCFELTVSLLRAMEMLVTLIPELFESILPNGDIILNRACQLIVQILIRTTLPLGCFQTIIDANLPELCHVTHFAVLSATIGLFLALMQHEMGKDDCIIKVPKVSRVFLTDPGFHIACLQFTLGEGGLPASWQNIPRGNFDPNLGRELPTLDFLIEAEKAERRSSIGSTRSLSSVAPVVKFDFKNYPTHILDAEIEKVSDLITILQIRQSLLSEITVFSEESLCPICCARKNNTTFEPCHHQSCQNCIIQHLMNEKLCFYCKSLIKKVINNEGDLVYESKSNIPSPPTTPIG